LAWGLSPSLESVGGVPQPPICAYPGIPWGDLHLCTKLTEIFSVVSAMIGAERQTNGTDEAFRIYTKALKI
jgi:hypothetical protein